MRRGKIVFTMLCLALLCVSAAGAATAGAFKTYTNSIGMKFALIPAGSVSLKRNHDSERKRNRREKTVVVGKPFYLGVCEVTQEQWMTVMGSENNPSAFKGPRHPVEHVSWDDAQEFINRLNTMEGHGRYRLPTETEWLYTVFSGAEPSYFSKKEPTTWAEAKDFFGDHAWFYMHADDPTHPVGQKRPNRYGLHDLVGNVHEWVQNQDAASLDASADATVPSPRYYQVYSGDSWRYLATYCLLDPRFSRPDPRSPRIGLRLALTLE